MSKTTLGSLANATAVVAMIGRVAVVLGAEPGFGSGLPSGPTCADRWRVKIAADTAGSSFSFWAGLGPYICVKNIADGIIYKVLKNPAVTSGYTQEKTQLDANPTASWLPDYWYYDAAPNVMCIREYPLVVTRGNVWSTSDAVGFHDGTFSNTAEIVDLRASGVKFWTDTLATNPANGKFVLIDATA